MQRRGGAVLPALPRLYQRHYLQRRRPLYTGNREEIERLARKVKLEYPEKNIWLYTGYRWEEISALPLMQYIDVLVDGKFIADLKDTKLHWKGSFNQRIIDVQKSLQSSSLYLYHAE